MSQLPWSPDNYKISCVTEIHACMNFIFVVQYSTPGNYYFIVSRMHSDTPTHPHTHAQWHTTPHTSTCTVIHLSPHTSTCTVTHLTYMCYVYTCSDHKHTLWNQLNCWCSSIFARDLRWLVPPANQQVVLNYY